MKHIKNEFNEKVYNYTSASGLNVFIVQRPGFKRSVAAYGTPFGALDLVQEANGKRIHHKKGLAHFLEHKLFENDGEDILSQFTNLGASANAFTSYDQTVYYFSTNLDLYRPLELLLSFVREFDITQEKVDKEKGIIVEELKMYEKQPEMKLVMSTYENVYHHFPLRYDIGGTQESVLDTNLEDLNNAYYYNYHDSRMCLVVISGQDPLEIKDTIDRVSKSDDTPIPNVKTVFEHEPLSVKVADSIEAFPVSTPKMSLAYKFKYDGDKPLYDEFVLRLILMLNFNEFNEAYQSWIDQEIINDYFSFDVDLRDGFGVIYFFNEGNDSEAFKSMIENQMRQLSINEADFKQVLRRYYGQMIMELSQYDRFAINLMTTYFKGVNYYDYLSFIKDLKIDDCKALLPLLSQVSVSFTQLIKK